MAPRSPRALAQNAPIAELLRGRVAALGISVRELNERLGKPAGYSPTYTWLKGTAPVPGPVREPLAKALGIDAAALLSQDVPTARDGQMPAEQRKQSPGRPRREAVDISPFRIAFSSDGTTAHVQFDHPAVPLSAVFILIDWWREHIQKKEES